MSVVETAKKNLEEKGMADIAFASAHSPDAPNKLLRKLSRGQKNFVNAPTAGPPATTVQAQPAPQPVDTVAMQNYVSSLSPEGLKALSDMVKKALEAKDSPVQTAQQTQPNSRPF